ncbi:MAG: glycosyltransferase family 4 protein [Anaerolineales bacterium]|nr:glycosyltransferase family 4 protein [Anaerolineales bacterium]
MKRVCVYPNVSSPGGVGSFRYKLSTGLAARGIEVLDDLYAPELEAVLVLAGTRNLLGLWQAKRKGVPIIQRLDGINWVQRTRPTSLRYHLRAEYGNWNLAFIRRHLADRVVYQSRFVRGWWEAWYGKTLIPSYIILNGVDLDEYNPRGSHRRPEGVFRILLVEGSLAGGLDFGLEIAVQMAEKVAEKFPIELVIAGRSDKKKQEEFQGKNMVPVKFLGFVERTEIPEIDRSAHLYFSAEINPPCPNSVVEALACGLPVVGFDTGSLAELVGKQAGRLVAYGGDPWKLEQPDIPALAEAAGEILRDLDRFRAAARQRAEGTLGLDAMVEKYLEVLA